MSERDARAAALEATAKAATPGPWQWRFYGNDGPDLVAAHSGMLYVMGFVRRGMNGAEPVFAERERKGDRWSGGLMRKFSEWWKRDSKLAPDAAYIAAADPTTVLALIDRVRVAEAERDALRTAMEGIIASNEWPHVDGVGWECRCGWHYNQRPGRHDDGCPVPAAEHALATTSTTKGETQ